jgi:hypothetical protein
LENQVFALAILGAAIFCGIWADMAAPLERRGKFLGTFFWLGVLLGPVGVLGAALAQPRPKTRQAQPDRRTA